MRYPVCKSTDRAAVVVWARRLKKRHPTFSLTVLASGYWCKKINGRQQTFGPLGDPNAALAAYKAYMDGDEVGGEGVTIDEVVQRFIGAMMMRCDRDGLSYDMLDEYKRTGRLIFRQLGQDRRVVSLRPSDFARFRAWIGKHRRGKGVLHVINYVRTIFKWAYDNHLIDVPIRYGTEFRGPSKRELRRYVETLPPKMFEADQVRMLIDPTSIAGQFRRNRECWRAMQLLGVNCGFSGIDCAEITFDAIDFNAGFHTFRRPKTMEPRRAFLWPETVEAIRTYLTARESPSRGCERHLFVNSVGGLWITRSTATKGRVDNVCNQFRGYLRKLKLWQSGNNFGVLRHVFATIARETGERDAVELALGHVPDGVTAEFYLERVPDSGLRRIADHVRAWLFGEDG